MKSDANAFHGELVHTLLEATVGSLGVNVIVDMREEPREERHSAFTRESLGAPDRGVARQVIISGTSGSTEYIGRLVEKGYGLDFSWIDRFLTLER